MPVSVEAVTVASATANSISVAEPVGVQVGDVLILAHRAQNTRTEYPGPEGFVRITPYIHSSNDARTLGIWARVITNSDPRPASYSISLGGASTRQQMAMMLVRGLDPTDPVADVVQSYTGEFAGDRLAVESLNADVETFQVFIAGGEIIEGNPHQPSAPPAGFTEAASLPEGTSTTGSRTALWAGYRMVDAGPTGVVESGWVWQTGGGAQSVLFRPLGVQPRLATPVVTLGATQHPSSASATDGTQTVSWDPVPDAGGYSAHLATGLDPDQSDFTQVAASVTSPYTFTGLAEGTYAFGIRARV